MVTLATGICLAMAVAQAAVDANLKTPDRSLELLTASIKYGIKNSGLLNLNGKLAHDHRVHLLQNVRRSWPGMSLTESASQLKWYLEKCASSFSFRTAVMSEDT